MCIKQNYLYRYWSQRVSYTTTQTTLFPIFISASLNPLNINSRYILWFHGLSYKPSYSQSFHGTTIFKRTLRWRIRWLILLSSANLLDGERDRGCLRRAMMLSGGVLATARQTDFTDESQSNDFDSGKLSGKDGFQLF